MISNSRIQAQILWAPCIWESGMHCAMVDKLVEVSPCVLKKKIDLRKVKEHFVAWVAGFYYYKIFLLGMFYGFINVCLFYLIN